jgi:ATP-dependent DNA helicase RecQ
LALTATAAPLVQTEIIERLEMRDPNVIVQGFDRPNIDLCVERFEAEDEKQAYLIQQVVAANKPGIVYTATRKRAEALAELLNQVGVKAGFYHARMKKDEREQAEIAFMQDELEVLVATTAFGMGIDKPNVRFVFHAEISDSIDSYYQEIGRAGRDSASAQAILFYQPTDLNLKRFFSSQGQFDQPPIKLVLKELRRHKSPVSVKQLLELTDLSKAKLIRLLSRFTEVGVVAVSPTGEISLIMPLKPLNQIIEAMIQAQQQRQQIEKSRLTMMQGFAEVRGCRREYLLNYFGEQFNSPCNACDNCRAGITAEDTSHQPYALNAQVMHKEWGQGIVMRYEGGKVVILFDQVGYKTLDIQTALLRRLLQRIDSA